MAKLDEAATAYKHETGFEAINFTSLPKAASNRERVEALKHDLQWFYNWSSETHRHAERTIAQAAGELWFDPK